MTLENTPRDRLVAAAKGLAGGVPFVGALAAEIIGATIPNQRLERIARFLELLSERVSDMDKDLVAAKMRTEEFVDLFEDGMFQASRALSDERKQYLASLIGNAIGEDAVEHSYEKRLLQILGEINDVEILILQSHALSFSDALDFHKLHEERVRGPRATMASPPVDRERTAVHSSYIAHLTSLGLLAPRFRRPARDQVPEFDVTTGMIKAQGVSVTMLGQVLLRYLDLDRTGTPHSERR